MARPDLSFEPLGEQESSLTDKVMNRVRAAVVSGVMQPGELYSVYQLAETLGVSRSPVRDAMLRLEEAGLVRFERNRGFRVIQPRPEDIAEIFALRLALEVPSAKRAALLRSDELLVDLRHEIALMVDATVTDDEARFSQHDQRFHELIIEVSGNQRIRDVVNRLRTSTRILGASTAGVDRTLVDIAEEHNPIVEAIGRGDGGAAAAAMHAHLCRTGRLLVQQNVKKLGLDLDGDEVWERITSYY
ncbi:GntR family transcriptional regulator [Specibacter sp. RAF43]|uniref:GntR family transcriptional regulator n=1 Tax=Specibacter sp. RAF43 TaxID=3233057 RepID=UPI003F9E22C1